MDQLRSYLNNLTKEEQLSFAGRCGTTLGYLRKAISTGQRIGADLAVLLSRESDGAVSFGSIRPDVDWAYVQSASAEKLSASGNPITPSA